MPRKASERLPVRQQEVLSWMFVGKANSEIAAILGLSPLTIKNHVSTILKKTGAPTKCGACHEGLRRGWLKAPESTAPPFTPTETMPVDVPPEPPKFIIGDVTVFASGDVVVGGNTVRVHKRSLLMLECFARCFGRIQSVEHLLEVVWSEQEATYNTVVVRVNKLREVLKGSQIHIENIRGIGYRMSKK